MLKYSYIYRVKTTHIDISSSCVKATSNFREQLIWYIYIFNKFTIVYLISIFKNVCLCCVCVSIFLGYYVYTSLYIYFFSFHKFVSTPSNLLFVAFGNLFSSNFRLNSQYFFSISKFHQLFFANCFSILLNSFSWQWHIPS